MYRLMVIEDDKGIAGAIAQQAQMWELEVHCVEPVSYTHLTLPTNSRV